MCWCWWCVVQLLYTNVVNEGRLELQAAPQDQWLLGWRKWNVWLQGMCCFVILESPVCVLYFIVVSI